MPSNYTIANNWNDLAITWRLAVVEKDVSQTQLSSLASDKGQSGFAPLTVLP
jgi:hypothetical protein